MLMCQLAGCYRYDVILCCRCHVNLCRLGRCETVYLFVLIQSEDIHWNGKSLYVMVMFCSTLIMYQVSVRHISSCGNSSRHRMYHVILLLFYFFCTVGYICYSWVILMYTMNAPCVDLFSCYLLMIHNNDVIMSAMTSQITSVSIVLEQIKENIKAPRHWPLWGNSPIPRSKGQ